MRSARSFRSGCRPPQCRQRCVAGRGQGRGLASLGRCQLVVGEGEVGAQRVAGDDVVTGLRDRWAAVADELGLEHGRAGRDGAPTERAAVRVGAQHRPVAALDDEQEVGDLDAGFADVLDDAQDAVLGGRVDPGGQGVRVGDQDEAARVGPRREVHESSGHLGRGCVEVEADGADQRPGDGAGPDRDERVCGDEAEQSGDGADDVAGAAQDDGFGHGGTPSGAGSGPDMRKPPTGWSRAGHEEGPARRVRSEAGPR